MKKAFNDATAIKAHGNEILNKGKQHTNIIIYLIKRTIENNMNKYIKLFWEMLKRD